MKKTTTRLIIVIACLCGLYLLLQKCNFPTTIEFSEKLDSLQKVNDSLLAVNQRADSVITELAAEDARLTDIIEDQKDNVKVIRETVIKEVVVIKAADSLAIVKFFNDRYSEQANTADTLIPINKPVLVFAAADLIKYDGAVKEIAIKDSIITNQTTRIDLKDSTIGFYKTKEANLQTIIKNKDVAITEWTTQYNAVSLQNKKLKLQSKIQKIGSLILIGGLGFFLVTK
jgi:hypothetical protein